MVIVFGGARCEAEAVGVLAGVFYADSCLPSIRGRCRFVGLQSVSCRFRCLWSLQHLGAGRRGWQSEEQDGCRSWVGGHLSSPSSMFAPETGGPERLTSGSVGGCGPPGCERGARGQQSQGGGWAWRNRPRHEPVEPGTVVAGKLWKYLLALPLPFF